MSVAKLRTRKWRNAERIEGVSPSLLRRYSRLSGLSVANLERVARGSECQLIPAGNTIFTQRDGADAIVIRTPLSLLRDVLASNPELARAWIHAVSTDLQRRERRLAGSMRELIANPAFPDTA